MVLLEHKVRKCTHLSAQSALSAQSVPISTFWCLQNTYLPEKELWISLCFNTHLLYNDKFCLIEQHAIKSMKIPRCRQLPRLPCT